MTLQNKEYRAATVVDYVRTTVALQIRNLREDRGWTQSKLAQEAGTKQSVIARLEDPEYGGVSLSTMLKLASIFDVAVIAKMVPFSKFLREYSDFSPAGLSAISYEAEVQQIANARANDDTVFTFANTAVVGDDPYSSFDFYTGQSDLSRSEAGSSAAA